MGKHGGGARWRCATSVAAVAVAVPVLLVSGPTEAGEIGHFAAGLISGRDYVLPPKLGVYTSAYNYFYTTDV